MGAHSAKSCCDGCQKGSEKYDAPGTAATLKVADDELSSHGRSMEKGRPPPLQQPAVSSASIPFASLASSAPDPWGRQVTPDPWNQEQPMGPSLSATSNPERQTSPGDDRQRPPDQMSRQVTPDPWSRQATPDPSQSFGSDRGHRERRANDELTQATTSSNQGTPAPVANTADGEQSKSAEKSSAAQAPPDPEPKPLTEREISLVEESWMKVEAIGNEAVGVLLFKTIFELSPETLQKFSFRNEPGVLKSTKLKKHGVKVVNFVGVAVGGLRDLEGIVPGIQEMGLKHIGFDIVPKKDKAHYEYYRVVGKALIMTLQQGLGKDFTPELETAWTKVYATVSQTMIEVNIEMAAKMEAAVVNVSENSKTHARAPKRTWTGKGGLLPRLK